MQKTTTSDSPSGFAPLEGHGVQDDELEVGFVVGVFGTQGEVRLHLHNRESAMFRKRRKIVLVDGEGRRWATTLKSRTGAGNRVIGALDGPRFREDAHALRDWRVVVKRTMLPQLDGDEFYLVDLIGCEVAVDGDVLGKVLQVHQHGPVDILEIQTASGSGYVPAVARYIADVHARPVVLHEEARGLLA